ncbi:MAG TPA: TA system VapC family ribonuclease toxin [Solirubrobacterales bacterium]
MSVTVDTNILVYATDTGSEVGEAAQGLIERLARGPDLLYVFWPALIGFIRIATHPTINERPLTSVEAVDSVAALLARPHVRAPGESAGFLRIYEATAPKVTRGRQVPDAHIAALMRQHGVATIYTRDTDFRRFDGIKVEDPFG